MIATLTDFIARHDAGWVLDTAAAVAVAFVVRRLLRKVF